MSKKIGHYVHGTHEEEQKRLAQLNALTNESFIHFIGFRKSDQILELGSGLGIVAEKISKSLTNSKVTGIEYFYGNRAKGIKTFFNKTIL